LLFLIAIVLGDLGLEQDAIRFIFGFDIYSRYLLFRPKKSTEIWLAQLPTSRECRVAGFADLRLIRLIARPGENESRERTAGATGDECACRRGDGMEDNFRLTPEMWPVQKPVPRSNQSFSLSS
jgi:hypothetical protein